MSLEHLITDRTAHDVDRVKILSAKAWQDMTAEERAEWASPMRGAYNHTDLNRVEEAVTFVAERLREFGYVSDVPLPRLWSIEDKPTEEDLSQCFGKVATLREATTVWASTPKAPRSIDGFDANKANDLEQILVDIHQVLNYIKDAWFFSGDLYSAEV